MAKRKLLNREREPTKRHSAPKALMSYGTIAHLFVHAAKPNTESTIAIPTWEMRQAGNAIVESLQVHQFNLRLYGLGEAKTLEDWIPDSEPNKDLIVGYLQNKLDTPTCVYLAMQRAKVA